MKKIFWWIGGGILITAGAFFIPEQSGSLWPSVIASGGVAFLYLLVFAVVWLKKINSSAKRKGIAVTLTVLFVFSLAWSLWTYDVNRIYEKNFQDGYTEIEANLMYSHIHKPLINTLARYYKSEENDKSLGKLFISKYGSLITEDSTFADGSFSSPGTIHLHLKKAGTDSVVIMGESKYLEGKRKDFENFSGAIGRYQVRGMLTSKGVDYERQN